jgi:hypothetical protein
MVRATQGQRNHMVDRADGGCENRATAIEASPTNRSHQVQPLLFRQFAVSDGRSPFRIVVDRLFGMRDAVCLLIPGDLVPVPIGICLLPFKPFVAMIKVILAIPVPTTLNVLETPQLLFSVQLVFAFFVVFPLFFRDFVSMLAMVSPVLLGYFVLVLLTPSLQVVGFAFSRPSSSSRTFRSSVSDILPTILLDPTWIVGTVLMAAAAASSV